MSKQQRTLLKERPAQTCNGLNFSLHVTPRITWRQDIEPTFVSLRIPAGGKLVTHVSVSPTVTDNGSASKKVAAPQEGSPDNIDLIDNKESPSSSASGGSPPAVGGSNSSNIDSSAVFVGLSLVTFQETTEELIDFTEGGAEGKDRGRERFFEWMSNLERVLREKGLRHGHRPSREPEPQEEGGEEQSFAYSSPAVGVVVDWPDPATGLPMVGDSGPCVHNELDVIEQLLAYDITHVCGPGGGCRVVSHPKFGAAVYPASAFLLVPSTLLETVVQLIASL